MQASGRRFDPVQLHQFNSNDRASSGSDHKSQDNNSRESRFFGQLIRASKAFIYIVKKGFARNCLADRALSGAIGHLTASMTMGKFC